MGWTLVLKIAIFLAVAAPVSFAQQSPFQQMIEKDLGLNSRESFVTIHGVRYQKIEIENQTFYVVFKGRNSEIPNLLCDQPKGAQSEHLIEGSIKVMRRKRIFFNALKESCIVEKGQQQASVQLDPQLGFYLPESSSDKIKNKKIGINPLNPANLNFSGEF